MNNLNTNDFKSFVFYRNSDHSDMNRWLKRSLGTHDPIRLIKYTNTNLINTYSNDLTDNDITLFRFRFNTNNNIVGKDPNNIYFAFKQKRYNVRKKFVIKGKKKKNIINV
jgi:hypothetical protein